MRRLLNAKRRALLFILFPQLRLVKFTFEFAKCFYNCYKKPKNKPGNKMKFSIKLAIGCGVTLFFFVVFGFIAFPAMIKGKIKKMITLDEKSEIRQMFVNIPFPLEFRVYIFNVTNPKEVDSGEIPTVQEVGPFCFEEWKKKVDIEDNDDEDVMFYKPVDTFMKASWPGCLTGDELVTIPHPLITGVVNTLIRTKPGTLGLINKAFISVFQNPSSIFVTASAMDILFDGLIINCAVIDFPGKALCTKLKTEAEGIKHLPDNKFALALLAPKNGTKGKTFKVLKGTKKSHDVGRIIEYDNTTELNVWPTKACNQFRGTDGTIFPPLMTQDEGIVSFAPDLCRSLKAVYSKKAKYDGISVSLYTATLGDMSQNADEKCFCPTPETCLKKGLMDLFKCIGVPMYASLPHFYESDESYLKGVKGLKPNEANHGIEIYFERTTGSPVAAKKRLMFSMPIEPTPKVPIFNNLPTTILPLFWVEEGVSLNRTFTKPLKDLFMIKKVVKIVSILAIIASVLGLSAAGYLFTQQSGDMSKTLKVSPKIEKNGIENFGEDVNYNAEDNEATRY